MDNCRVVSSHKSSPGIDQRCSDDDAVYNFIQRTLLLKNRRKRIVFAQLNQLVVKLGMIKFINEQNVMGKLMNEHFNEVELANFIAHREPNGSDRRARRPSV